jgi:hypothetical protein
LALDSLLAAPERCIDGRLGAKSMRRMAKRSVAAIHLALDWGESSATYGCSPLFLA